MAEILLTNGLTAIVDEDDFYWLDQWNWQGFTDSDGNTYAFRSRRSQKNKDKGLTSRAYMHRIIMRTEDPNIFIDHINGNRLDNRKANLRLCTATENTYNKRPKDNCSSIYKGVSFDKERQLWKASLRTNKTRISKRFKTEVDAAKWYDMQALKHHGEYAYLNFKTR